MYFGPRVVLDELHLVFKPDSALVHKKRLAAYPLTKSVWDSGQPASVWPQRVSVQVFALVFHRLIDEDDPLFTQRLAEGVLKQQRRAGKFILALQLEVSFATS